MNRPAASLRLLGLLTLVLPLAGLGCDGDGKKNDDDRVPGQTDFTNEETGPGGGFSGPAIGGNPTGAPADSAGGRGNTPPPSGRTGPVEEADIYRIADNRLFYLNTYRGFLIYDVNDPKQPRLVSRLPVYGYPVEMFVSGNTVYALLRDALYLTQTNGALEFQRHNVSQLVAIDVSDINQPRVLQTVDIVGELREGVSRKIENTVYVVSYVPQSYYWGWGYELDAGMPRKEQAWVYSFNVADPRNLQLVQSLKVFEGGSVSEDDPVTGGHVSRSFGGVAISATSNSLMVVENWYISSWTPGTSTPAAGRSTCGSYTGDQRSIVSIVDVSNPTGAIRLHSRFQTQGALGDQFKQTYVYDDATATATYYGIFARQAWSSVDCSSMPVVQNTLESWDVTNGAAPVKLDALDFGKPNETVRGSAFDATRKVAYAITAQAIDPLYVLSYADRANLTIRSAIDGLSGDMNLFRLVEGNQYLIGIGRDASETCSGFQGSEQRRGIGMAVSLIDVRNLDAIRLMQRQCVSVENAEWVSSEINWNLDQAHKMIGMHSDGTTNVITVPVSYYKQTQDASWWWYQWETAVGIMSWDVAAFDPARSPAEQTVIRNYGTFLHPNGEVRRSIVFTHQGATPRRMMINLSDTHVSIANLQNLAAPQLESQIEIAPYVSQLYAFGGHVVERIDDSPYGWYGRQGRSEFRVKRAGSNLDEATPVARFSVGQVTNVVQHGQKLIVFRSDQDPALPTAPAMTEVLVYDLANPAAPARVGSVKTSLYLYPSYWFFCGVGLWDGYWWGQGDSRWTATADALLFLSSGWDSAAQKSTWSLVEIDLRDPAAPAVRQTPVEAPANTYLLGLLPDAADANAFFLGSYEILGQRTQGTTSLTQTRYFAQRYRRDGAGWRSDDRVNLPGRLLRSWYGTDGARLYLTSDWKGYETTTPEGQTVWRQDTRLHLLRALGNLAELRSSHRFADQTVSDIVIDGNRLFANASPGYRYYFGGGVAIGGPAVTDGVTRSALTAADASDRLTVFDLSTVTLNPIYDRPTGTMNVQLMGTHRGLLFMNLRGDGLLAVDVANPAKPVGRQFLRTLGWASHVVFAENDVYVGAGYFGVYRMNLANPGVIAGN